MIDKRKFDPDTAQPGGISPLVFDAHSRRTNVSEGIHVQLERIVQIDQRATPEEDELQKVVSQDLHQINPGRYVQSRSEHSLNPAGA